MVSEQGSLVTWFFFKAFIVFDPISLRPLLSLLAIARPILLYRWTISEAITSAFETAVSNFIGSIFGNPTTPNGELQSMTPSYQLDGKNYLQ